MPIYTFTDSSSGSLEQAANGGTLTAKAQDNPVETVRLKYIYIIRNNINDKVYVGQAVNPKERFLGHIRDGNRTDKPLSAIDGAIKKYGKDNFYYEVIEGPIPNYNEREKYWIWFFDCIAPKGYNIMAGGEDPPIMRGFDNPSCKLKPEDIPTIIELLKNPYLTLTEIGARFNCGYRTMKKINRGIMYKTDGVSYPIRDYKKSGDPQKQLPRDVVDHIISDITTTDLSLRKIAQKHNVKVGVVYAINEGTNPIYKRGGFQYPLKDANKKIDLSTVQAIQKDLMGGVLNKNQIAKKYDVTYAQISAICSGRSYFDQDLVYPLTPAENQLGLSEELIENIRLMLQERKSNKEIFETLKLPNYTIITDINVGASHVSEKYSYPIRPKIERIHVPMVRNIEDDIINSNLSFRKIASKYGVDYSSVQAINVGKWIRRKDENKNYPLRTFGRSKKKK